MLQIYTQLSFCFLLCFGEVDACSPTQSFGGLCCRLPCYQISFLYFLFSLEHSRFYAPKPLVLIGTKGRAIMRQKTLFPTASPIVLLPCSFFVWAVCSQISSSFCLRFFSEHLSLFFFVIVNSTLLLFFSIYVCGWNPSIRVLQGDTLQLPFFLPLRMRCSIKRGRCLVLSSALYNNESRFFIFLLTCPRFDSFSLCSLDRLHSTFFVLHCFCLLLLSLYLVFRSLTPSKTIVLLSCYSGAVIVVVCFFFLFQTLPRASSNDLCTLCKVV